MAAEKLLESLNLYGFSDTSVARQALEEACQTKEAADIVGWLAENLTPELFSHVLEEAHPCELTKEEESVAEAFEKSLRLSYLRTKTADSEEQEKRKRTTNLILEASTKLSEEAAQISIEAASENRRSELRISDTEEQIQVQEAMLQQLLKDLDSTVCSLFSELSSKSSKSTLLCLQHLKEFRDLDDKLMFTAKKFYEDQFLSSPDQEWSVEGLNKGTEKLLFSESFQSVGSRALELERMRLAFGSSLEGSIRMSALQAKQEKTLQALQGGLTRPELGSQDVLKLKEEADKQQVYLDRIVERKKQLLEVELPRMCRSVASMQGLDSIKAEYDIELQRNKYYSSKKEELVEVLCGRAARIACLVSAAQNEAHAVMDISHNLQLFVEEVASLIAAADLRLSKCSFIQNAKPPLPLPPSPDFKAVSGKDFGAAQEAFENQLEEIMAAAIPSMQKASGTVHALVFPDKDICNPVITSENFLSAKSSLEAVHKILLEANDGVYKQQEAYNNILRLQREKIGLERSVFSTFFTQPEKLVKQAQALVKAPHTKPKTKAIRSRISR